MSSIDTSDDQDQGSPPQDQGESWSPPSNTQGGNSAAPFGAPSGNDQMSAAAPGAFPSQPQGPMKADTGMITADYTIPGDKTLHSVQLTPRQLAQYLHVGQDGQWDKQMAQGIPTTLQKIVGAAGSDPANGGAQALGPATPPADKTQASPAQGSADDDDDDDGTPAHYTKTQRARAMEAYPNISEQGPRSQFLAAQTNSDEDRASKEAIAKTAANSRITMGEQKLEGWKYSTDGKERAAMAKSAQQMAQEGAKRGDKFMETQFNLFAKLGLTGQPVPPKLQSYVDQFAGVQQKPTPQAPTPQTPGAPQAQDPSKGLQQTAAGHPPPAQRQVGYTVTTSKGTFSWNGQGWDPK